MAIIDTLSENRTQVTSFVLVFTISYILFIVIYRLFFSPMSKIPGPWMTCISTAPETKALKEQRRTQWVNSLFARYPGAVAVRTGPNSVSFNHPDAVKAIYGLSRTIRLLCIQD